MARHDLHFHFDPVCPFAWVTSRWVERVAELRGLSVDWRFVSLRILNKNVDYDTHFPEGYLQGHTTGLHLLRVAAAVRAAHGHELMGPLYTGISGALFDVDPPEDRAAFQAVRGTRDHVVPVLESLGLDVAFAEALDDDSWDDEIAKETEEALALTGRDVGTPVIAFEPPNGPAFFGPVISRLPDDEASLRLWDAVVELVHFPGFSELKRSLREPLALRVIGRAQEDLPPLEDWHQGSRRLKK